MTDKLERRQRILDMAVQLFGQNDPYTVQMEDIAKAAGVAKGTLYNHFGSKEQLYLEALRSRLENLADILQQAYKGRKEPWRDLRSFLIHWQSFMLRHPHFFSLYRRANGKEAKGELLALHQRVRGILHDVLKNGIDSGLFRDCTIDDTTDLIMGMLDHRVAALLQSDSHDNDPESILNLLRFGLKKRKRR